MTFHPAWHEIMRLAVAAGVHSRPWTDPRPGAQAARGALVHLHAQAENGTQCPLTMTYASVPVLRRAPAAIAATLCKLDGTLVYPWPLSPQATTVPSPLSANAWLKPAAVALTSLSPGGTLV